MTRDRMVEYKEACKYVPNVKCDTDHQKEMFTNAYFAACDLIGGLENTLYDYPEDDPEYIEAQTYLNKHDNIVNDIYNQTNNALYGAGYCCYSDNAKTIAKHFRFAGKEWTRNAIEEIVKSMGY